jgi:hypothetical protein
MRACLYFEGWRSGLVWLALCVEWNGWVFGILLLKGDRERGSDLHSSGITIIEMKGRELWISQSLIWSSDDDWR